MKFNSKVRSSERVSDHQISVRALSSALRGPATAMDAHSERQVWGCLKKPSPLEIPGVERVFQPTENVADALSDFIQSRKRSTLYIIKTNRESVLLNTIRQLLRKPKTVLRLRAMTL